MSSGKNISEFLIKTPMKVKIHKKTEPQSTINLREICEYIKKYFKAKKMA